MAFADRAKHAADPSGVPFTRASLDGLRALSTRFALLQRPIPNHVIVEIAIARLCAEYCLYDSEIQPSDTPTIQQIKKSSRNVLSLRYREYADDAIAARMAARKAKQTA